MDMNPDFQKAFEQAQSQQGSMKFTEGMCWKIFNNISIFLNNFQRKRKSSRKPLMIQNSANFLLITWTKCKVHCSLVSSIYSPTSFADPKHREETEEYIRQLEGEQKVPEGKELIR